MSTSCPAPIHRPAWASPACRLWLPPSPTHPNHPEDTPAMLKHDPVEGRRDLSHRYDVGLWLPAAGLRRRPHEAFQHHFRIDLDHLLLAETAAGLEPGADAGEHGKDTE